MRLTRTRVLWLALLVSVVWSPVTHAQEAASGPALAVSEEEWLFRETVRLRRETNRMRRIMGKRRFSFRVDPAAFASTLEYRRRLHDAWKAQLARTSRRFRHPPHLRAWRCIHRYEGPWKDPHAPYFGGLQMDLAFQRAYGRMLLRSKGTANRWTRFEQMWVAERALRRGRGFHPWPNTARYCGLL
jgi:hypothetical protein